MPRTKTVSRSPNSDASSSRRKSTRPSWQATHRPPPDDSNSENAEFLHNLSHSPSSPLVSDHAEVKEEEENEEEETFEDEMFVPPEHTTYPRSTSLPRVDLRQI